MSEQNTVVGRHDAVIDFGSPGWKESLQFLEPNLGGIGGLHLIPTASHILARWCCRLCGLATRSSSWRPARTSGRSSSRISSIISRRPGGPGRTVCFVEPKYAGYGPDEQGELARYVHEHFGIEVCHADPAELALEGDEVTYQGRVIDLVYRDYAVEDLLELEAEGVDMRPMQQAFATNRVVSSIAAELDQKSCWEVLGDPVLARRHFSGEERGFFRRHLPWTRLLRPATTTLPDGSRGNLVEYVRDAREDWCSSPTGATAAQVSPSARSPRPRSGGAGGHRPGPRRRALGGPAARPASRVPVPDPGRRRAAP